MMGRSELKITMDQAIEAVLSQAEGQLVWDDFVAQVLARWPSKAKNPAASIRNGLGFDRGRRAVLLDNNTVLAVRLVMNGLQFRITLSRAEVENKVVRLIPWFVPFPLGLEHFTTRTERLPHLIDEKDRPIEAQRTSVSIPVENWRGEMEDQLTPALDIASWLTAYLPQRGDSVLVTVTDWSRQEYRLAFESAHDRHPVEIEQQNQRLTRAIYEQVSHHRDERPFAREILVYAYARVGEAAHAYPGDHWSELIEADPRLGHLGYQQLGLARYVSMDEEPLLLAEATPNALEPVYHFKAYFKHRPGLWRRIEIQGRNTLGEFDQIMRQVFHHDWDHLSEFFIRPKDRGRHARWEGYGYHPSFDEIHADELIVAEIPLQVGDQLKYVYDFGDWVEHLITLEEITEAKPNRVYPRLTGQNRPRYKYCVACREQGRKTRATWDCIRCSNAEQRDIWLCESCLDTVHADHYAVEIIY